MVEEIIQNNKLFSLGVAYLGQYPFLRYGEKMDVELQIAKNSNFRKLLFE